MTDIFKESLDHVRVFEENKGQFGVVEYLKPLANNPLYKYERVDVALTCQPFIDGPAEGTPHYLASGVDKEGNAYDIKWEVRNNWEVIEDEQEMVEDWEKPASVEQI